MASFVLNPIFTHLKPPSTPVVALFFKVYGLFSVVCGLFWIVADLKWTVMALFCQCCGVDRG
jgi:hypothetical protein